MPRPASDERRERLGAAAVYVSGAVLYFGLRELAGIDFIVSPLLYGLVLLGASAFRRRLLASAVLLVTWGIVVVLDGKGPLAEDRTAPVHIFGFGLGALITLLLERWIDRRAALESIAIIMMTTGVWFYLVEDFEVLESAWVWSLVLLVNAAALIASVLMSHRAPAGS
jgi:hypothetical protein